MRICGTACHAASRWSLGSVPLHRSCLSASITRSRCSLESASRTTFPLEPNGT
ncbi:MAG: hypothetical protein LBQ54_06645 [Planctomycetaceae bacterium]|nr:hypothetical protein [Planctomycetaceae bacterium]